MSAKKRAIAKARARAFYADKGRAGQPSKKEAHDGRLVRRHNRKAQFESGGWFHDDASVLGFCDTRMRVTTPPATARPTGKMLGWVKRGWSKQMNKLVPDNLMVSINHDSGN